MTRYTVVIEHGHTDFERRLNDAEAEGFTLHTCGSENNRFWAVLEKTVSESVVDKKPRKTTKAEG